MDRLIGSLSEGVVIQRHSQERSLLQRAGLATVLRSHGQQSGCELIAADFDGVYIAREIGGNFRPGPVLDPVQSPFDACADFDKPESRVDQEVFATVPCVLTIPATTVGIFWYIAAVKKDYMAWN